MSNVLKNSSSILPALSGVTNRITMFCILLTISLALLELQRVGGQSNLSRNSWEQEYYTACPPWFYFNSTSDKCECFHHPDVKVDVICTESAALLNFGSCMTYDNTTKTTSLGQCVSFLVHNRNVSTMRNYIELPKDLSELNKYMCAPMNRKGLVCSECIDGYGPSVFTYGFQCANCTGAWYGIPIYLLLEFAPITVFYFLILAFILYSQLVTLFLQSFATFQESIEYEQGVVMYILFQLVTVFYGVWNLDFVRYILPPFCISPHLKRLHITSILDLCLLPFIYDWSYMGMY